VKLNRLDMRDQICDILLNSSEIRSNVRSGKRKGEIRKVKIKMGEIRYERIFFLQDQLCGIGVR